MSEVWDALARDYGRRCVLDLHISDGEVEEVTEEQAAYVIPLLKKQLVETDHIGLDYGCGAGRWTTRLAPLFKEMIGFDPSKELIDLTPKVPKPWFFFSPGGLATLLTQINVVFNWVVLGGIEDEDLVATVHNMIALLAPGGLLVFADHMVDPGRETWWKFRPMSFYAKLFADAGLPLRRIGECRQLAHSVTIMAGRKP